MKVLIAVDDSEHSDKAFDFYFKKLHRDENEVLVYHCADVPVLRQTWVTTLPGSPVLRLTKEDVDRLVHEHKIRCKQLRDKFQMKCEEYQPHGTILVETKQGGAGHNIITQAESFKADMIVTGTRGRGLVSRAVLGSVSSFVIHHSNKPVVVCR